MDILFEFNERLRELMLQKNIKSEQLAKETNLGGSTIRYWLRGGRKTTLSSLLKLADFFGCSIEFLAGRSEIEIDFTPKTPPPFPQAIRKVMTERGYTRFKLDRETKFKDSYLYKWDHGSQPDLITLVELANLFNVTIDYLVGRES